MKVGRTLKDITQNRMFYGVKTGLNEAFIIDQMTRDKLVREDPACTAIIKPMLRGEDLRPWYQENEGRWLIFTRRGIDIDSYPAVKDYLQQFREQLEPRTADRDSTTSHGRKPGTYKWYEIQDSVDYYNEFDKPKIFWPDIARFPRFSWDERGQFVNNKGYILSPPDASLLGILQSRVCWFCISRLCAPLGERLGLMIYQHFTQFMINLPIPTLTEVQREQIGTLARQLTDVAQRRYEVRRKTAHRILHDLGNGLEARLNQRLELWWDLSFPEFRAEVQRVFKRDIPLKDRDDWEELLRERATQIRTLTDEIVRLETLLNAAVYVVFDLNDEEIALIERETKYKYGEW